MSDDVEVELLSHRPVIHIIDFPPTWAVGEIVATEFIESAAGSWWMVEAIRKVRSTQNPRRWRFTLLRIKPLEVWPFGHKVITYLPRRPR